VAAGERPLTAIAAAMIETAGVAPLVILLPQMDILDILVMILTRLIEELTPMQLTQLIMPAWVTSIQHMRLTATRQQDMAPIPGIPRMVVLMLDIRWATHRILGSSTLEFLQCRA